MSLHFNNDQYPLPVLDAVEIYFDIDPHLADSIGIQLGSLLVFLLNSIARGRLSDLPYTAIVLKFVENDQTNSAQKIIACNVRL